MSFYLRVVGALAKFTEYGHRTRVNFVPLNWLLIIAPMFCAVLAFGVKLNDKFHSYEVVSAFTVDDTFSSFERRPYFEISGKLLSHAQIVEEDQGDVKRAWSPLTNPKSQKIIYIERDKPLDEEENAIDFSSKGTLREIDDRLKNEIVSSLKNSLSLTQEDIDSSVNLQYVIVNEEPPVVSTLQLLLFFLLVFVFVFLVAQTLHLSTHNYIVFQREGSFPAVSAEGDPTKIEMHATGHFRLQNETETDAVHTRSYWATLETGQHAIVARLKRRDVPPDPNNIWGIVFRPGSISTLTPGLLYFGFAGSPSIEVGYVDDVDGKARTCIVSFSSLSDRQIALSKMLALQAS